MLVASPRYTGRSSSYREESYSSESIVRDRPEWVNATGDAFRGAIVPAMLRRTVAVGRATLATGQQNFGRNGETGDASGGLASSRFVKTLESSNPA
jgi:hypothetical protein